MVEFLGKMLEVVAKPVGSWLLEQMLRLLSRSMESVLTGSSPSFLAVVVQKIVRRTMGSPWIPACTVAENLGVCSQGPAARRPSSFRDAEGDRTPVAPDQGDVRPTDSVDPPSWRCSDLARSDGSVGRQAYLSTIPWGHGQHLHPRPWTRTSCHRARLAFPLPMSSC